jgi:hypothetical protein
MMTCNRHAPRNAAVARCWFWTGNASACSDVGDRHSSGTRTSRLTGSSEPRMAPMRCLVIDHLCSGLNRSRPTTTGFAVKSP